MAGGRFYCTNIVSRFPSHLQDLLKCPFWLGLNHHLLMTLQSLNVRSWNNCIALPSLLPCDLAEGRWLPGATRVWHSAKGQASCFADSCQIVEWKHLPHQDTMTLKARIMGDCKYLSTPSEFPIPNKHESLKARLTPSTFEKSTYPPAFSLTAIDLKRHYFQSTTIRLQEYTSPNVVTLHKHQMRLTPCNSILA